MMRIAGNIKHIQSIESINKLLKSLLLLLVSDLIGQNILTSCIMGHNNKMRIGNYVASTIVLKNSMGTRKRNLWNRLNKGRPFTWSHIILYSRWGVYKIVRYLPRLIARDYEFCHSIILNIAEIHVMFWHWLRSLLLFSVVTCFVDFTYQCYSIIYSIHQFTRTSFCFYDIYTYATPCHNPNQMLTLFF